MRINTNIIALTACNSLSTASKRTSQSIEKLSSGYKINSVRDNPVGSALSAKMKSQLKNLEKATQSTADGISVIETAESVLAEAQSMVQRMRELCVQGANDTYTDDDRASIMSEISQLRTEIDRVSESTDFNTKKLLNGDLGRKSYTNISGVDVSYISTDVAAGEYEIQMLRQLKETIAEFAALHPKLDKNAVQRYQAMEDLGSLLDQITMNLPVEFEKKQQVLEAFNLKERFETVCTILVNEIQIAGIRNRLAQKLKGKVEKNQKEYLLREQLRYIREELGEENSFSDSEQFEEKLKDTDESHYITV